MSRSTPPTEAAAATGPDAGSTPGRDETVAESAGAPGAEPGRRSGRSVKVLYIAGIGRSGSTLVARALGAVEDLAAVGEVMHFFGRGLTNNELCGCGRPVRDCPLWGRVAERLEEPGPPLPTADIERFRQRATEGGQLASLFSPLRTPSFEEKLEAYRGHLRRLYATLRRVAGAGAVVDSSKNAGYARVLSATPGVDLHLVHLVRDSRGVAHSLQKRKERPGVPWTGGEELLDRRRPGTAALFWSAAQLLVESLRSRSSSYLRVRYRDFVRRPATSLRRILRSADEFEGPWQLNHARDGSLDLESQHVLAGNPMREERGEIDLREDLEWRRELGTGSRSLVTALTLPLLGRYGYLTSGDGDGDGSLDPEERTQTTGAPAGSQRAG